MTRLNAQAKGFELTLILKKNNRSSLKIIKSPFVAYIFTRNGRKNVHYMFHRSME